LATRYVPGPTLAELINSEGPLEAGRLIALAAGLLEGLEQIHAAQLVHRDLKPSNVLMAEHGPVIIDFGIASAIDATSLTATGTTIGSAGWMSPEQLRGDPLTLATDVFSWGACVAFAGTGRPPFGTGRAEAIAYRVAHESPDLDGLPPLLGPAVVAAMTREARLRPGLDQLRQILSGTKETADATTLAGLWNTPDAALTLVQTGQRAGPRLRRRSLIALVSLVLVGLAGATTAHHMNGRTSARNGSAAVANESADTSTTVSSGSGRTTAPPRVTTTSAQPALPPEEAEPELQADLVGQTDLDPSRWRPSDGEPGQAFNMRVFDAWDHVYEFPVTMNGCDTRQPRVAWRSIDGPVEAGVSDFRDTWDDSPIEPEQIAPPAQSGTLLLNSCEQPAFRSASGVSNIAVEVSIHYPAVGD
jgi:serine/threonine protein kinase